MKFTRDEMIARIQAGDVHMSTKHGRRKAIHATEHFVLAKDELTGRLQMIRYRDIYEIAREVAA